MRRFSPLLLLLIASTAWGQSFKGPGQKTVPHAAAYVQNGSVNIGAAITLNCPTVGKLTADNDLTETAANPTITLNTGSCRPGQSIRLLPLRICNNVNCASGPGQPTFQPSGSIVWEATLGGPPSFDTASGKTDEIAFTYGADGKWHEYGFMLDPTTGTALANNYQQYSVLYGQGPGASVAGTPTACNSNGTLVVGSSTGPTCGTFIAGTGTTTSFTSNSITVSATGIYTHTLTGTTPTAVVQYATAPMIDRENELLAANVTSATLPANTATADSEIIHWLIRQPTSGAPFTLPSAAVGPFSAGAGTTIHAAANVSCPTIGTTTSATAPSELLADFVYNSAITEWLVTYCNTIN